MKTRQDIEKQNQLLLQASKAYYMDNTPIMSDKEYDALYDEVIAWEKANGIVLPHSISQQVGYEVVSKLKKEPHEQKALSLNKTKNVDELVTWTKGRDVVLSWKMDGLTVVATYDNGRLTKAVTRGNGQIGENVSHNAKWFKGLPQTIPYNGHLVVRGEAVVSYANFEKVNKEGKYSVARSYASGSVRQLDSREASKRHVEFVAFELVSPTTKSFGKNLDKLTKYGFHVVPHKLIHADNLKAEILAKESQVASFEYPVDGLVIMIDDMAYAKSLGVTEKYPNYGMAFKWKDETYLTVVRRIEWQASRTGRINPVVLFDTVEIDGSQVSRATGNNLSFLAEKGIGVGSVVEVYKANMIIPTIDKVVSNPQPLAYPAVCPSCGCPTSVRKGKDGSQVLVCGNSDCPAKHLEHFVHFVSRDAMNIIGLAKNTLEMLVNEGVIHTFDDLYRVKEHKELVGIDGFGQKSFDALAQAIEDSRQTSLDRLIYAMGIEGCGRHVSRDIAKMCKGNPELFVQAMDSGFDWRAVDGVGDVLNTNIHRWWQTGLNRKIFICVAENCLFAKIQPKSVSGNNAISGKTFCVTGKVTQFPNRQAVGEWIEQRGGKLTGSVSKKTDYLVNNDITSMSGKNKKAKELGVPIISEEDLLKLSD